MKLVLKIDDIRVHFAPNKNEDGKITPCVDIRFITTFSLTCLICGHNIGPNQIFWRPALSEIAQSIVAKYICDEMRYPKDKGYKGGEKVYNYILEAIKGLLEIFENVPKNYLTNGRLHVKDNCHWGALHFLSELNKKEKIPNEPNYCLNFIDDKHTQNRISINRRDK